MSVKDGTHKYQGTIVSLQPDNITGSAKARGCRIHYHKFSSYYDEIRLMSHLRKYDPLLQADAALTERDMVVGGKVAVLWGDKISTNKDAYAAHIVEICQGPFVQVTFQGYGDAWDRWYSPADLKVEERTNTQDIKAKNNNNKSKSKSKSKSKDK